MEQDQSEPLICRKVWPNRPADIKKCKILLKSFALLFFRRIFAVPNEGTRGVAQLASASGLGPEGPVFESQYPDNGAVDFQLLFFLFNFDARWYIWRNAIRKNSEITDGVPIIIGMIQAKGIEKSFGALKVLKGLDFSVSKSEVVSIMGASGAGKSTLLQILGTLSTPDSGSLVIDGIDVLKLKGDKLAAFRNLRLGFVFQFHHLLPEFTALENVMIPAFIAGRSRKEAQQHATELLNELGLGERLTHKPSELSGGEQQRVAIARALINRPAVLFADEPSGNLDSKTKEELHNLFFSLRDKYGQTIVIVTHDPDLAKMCDRSLFMIDGQFINTPCEEL